MIYTEGKTFTGVNFQEEHLGKGEYENCVFKSCDFSNIDLSEINFSECEFVDCNLSLAQMMKTAFRDVRFVGCKMLGLYFGNCNEFGLSFSFDGCQLNNSSFFKTKLKKTVFRNTQLEGVDFAECDLTNALFDNCNLAQAVFDYTLLEKCDFRTSYNYSIDPEANKIKGAKFSVSGVSGLLDKYDINIEQ